MALKINLITGEIVSPTTDEMAHSNFNERGRGCIRGDVAADAFVFPVGTHHHRHRIPANDALDASLDLAVSGKRRLSVGRNRVDVRSGRRERNRHAEPVGFLLDHVQEIAGPVSAPTIDDIAE